MGPILFTNPEIVLLPLCLASVWSSAAFTLQEDPIMPPVFLATSLSNSTQIKEPVSSAHGDSDNYYWNQAKERLSKETEQERNDKIDLLVTRFPVRTTTPKPKEDLSNSSRFWRVFGFISIAVLIIMTFMLLQKLWKGMTSGQPYPTSPRQSFREDTLAADSGQRPPRRERRRSLFRRHTSEDRPPPYSEVADLPAYPSAPPVSGETLGDYQISSTNSPLFNSRIDNFNPSAPIR